MPKNLKITHYLYSKEHEKKEKRIVQWKNVSTHKDPHINVMQQLLTKRNDKRENKNKNKNSCLNWNIAQCTSNSIFYHQDIMIDQCGMLNHVTHYLHFLYFLSKSQTRNSVWFTKGKKVLETCNH